MDKAHIESKIKKWANNLRKQDFLEDGVIEELEDHLRQSINKMLEEGMEPRDAFKKAVSRLGSPFDINKQERMVRAKNSGLTGALFLSYFIVALRNIRHRKFIATINMLGLALGISVSLLLGVYSWDIITYDQFHEKAEDIYFLYRTRPLPDGGQLDVSDTWAPLAEEVKNAFPSVRSIARIVDWGRVNVRYEDNDFREPVTFSEQGLFDMFSFPLAKGSKEEVFKEPRSVVISTAVADRIFGDSDPIGQTIRLTFNESIDYVVTGVLEKIPFNSSFQFDVIVNLESRRQAWTEFGYFGWRSSFMYSFVELKSGSNPEGLLEQFPQIVEKFIVPSERGTLELLPLAQYYDFMTGRQQYGFLLGYIALGLLFIAFFNFTNLNAAQLLLRNREVAVRKVFGALKKDLVLQFSGETSLIFGVSAILGIGISFFILPYFIELFGEQMSLTFLLQPVNLLISLGIIGTCGGIAGIYPTVSLSGLRPREAMHKIRVQGKKGFDPKNILVTGQFAIAITLVSAVLIIYQQINFMKEADMKFDPDNVMIIEAPPSPNDEDMGFDAFRNQLETVPGVEAVSATSSVPGRYRGSYVLVQPDDARDRPPLDWRFVDVDDKFFSTLRIKMFAGRDFDIDMASDQRKAVINEAALRQLGWEDAGSHKLMFPDSDEGFDVIGVVEDFNYRSLANSVDPVIHVFRGRSSGRYNMLMVRLSGSGIGETISQIRREWDRISPNEGMEYTFLDESFKRLYESEELIGTMTLYATCMAIFVAILGILGLASFTVIERLKEMAIRKVLGATARQLLMLLLQKTTWMVGIGLVIATPLSYYLMDDWLADFANRIEINWMIYLVSGLVIMIASWVVLGTYALKMVKTNPANTLRNE